MYSLFNRCRPLRLVVPALASLAIGAASAQTASMPVAGVQRQVDSLKQVATVLLADPALYNDAYAKFLSGLVRDSSKLYTFMRDMNVNFKTFQANGQPASLGFDYDYQNSWTKSRVTGKNASFQTYMLDFSGNVAYRVADNPANMLQSAFTYNASFMRGGRTRPLDSAERKQYQALNVAMVRANIAGNMQQVASLNRQRLRYVQTSNQYYAGINANFNYETNQDFSRQQFAPGVLVNLGAKAWNSSEPLLYFNLPDYPFALFRLLTGTDQTFTLSGASFPTALVGLDHVIPAQDAVRRSLAGNLDAYNRFRTEVAFKTIMAQFGPETIYFSADLRYYRELDAPAAVKAARQEKFSFFTASVQATNGFFVSYTSGRLPFDQQKSDTYGMGFHYNLGNFSK